MQTVTEAKLRLYVRRTQLLSRYHDEVSRADEVNSTQQSEIIDQADDEWNARVLAHMSETDLAELDEVSAALHRIERGCYGTCTRCGNPIEDKRLQALPAVALCADCATTSEERNPRWTMAVEAE